MGKFYYDEKEYPRWRDSNRLVHRDVAGADRDEVVHHRDGNTHNFRRDNLQRMFRSEHSRLHSRRRDDDW